ncbi:RNA-directed DNA polymerase [Luteimonas sp. SDU82]|uniref:RNA-directed DNA polymerase n=1 Tax=Luteimonas sp. SDU82 TaxID=3422592 RepID=UPI003EB72030
MTGVTLAHFQRAAADIGANGDNDTLPFDVDVRFVNERQGELAQVAWEFYQRLDLPEQQLRGATRGLPVFFERLLVPAGSAGFRVSTKIHPFWNIYLNGLGVAIAESNEPHRHQRVHSYRYVREGPRFFNVESSWRAFREACVAEVEQAADTAIVVQTDITSFYEHVYHHRVKSLIDDLFPNDPGVALQVDILLGKFSSGRSFGLPVGGQCARILAEVLLSEVDKALADEGLAWHRYVDDFVLITESQEAAYRALAKLSHALADYGLTLNRSKTTFLSAKHFVSYVNTQLGGGNDQGARLREIDLHFDPYSDNPRDDYEELRDTVGALEIQTLLDLELQKSQPDTFLVAQIGRTLRLHSPGVALDLCRTLLAPRNLHAFRASWSTIMRGIAAVRADEETFREIFDGLDAILDSIPANSGHLLASEANCLHYLRTLRFSRTERRGRFLRQLFHGSNSVTVRRACIDCWRQWKDRNSFIFARNLWGGMDPEQQRMLWLGAGNFGEDGRSFRLQEKRNAITSWALGLEREDEALTFAKVYMNWCEA